MEKIKTLAEQYEYKEVGNTGWLKLTKTNNIKDQALEKAIKEVKEIRILDGGEEERDKLYNKWFDNLTTLEKAKIFSDIWEYSIQRRRKELYEGNQKKRDY